MHHLLRNENRGFAGDEHDAAPVLRIEHALQIVPRQPHPAHDVDFEHFGPVVILDIEEGFGLVDAEIVDQNVDLGELRHQSGAAFGVAEIEHRRMRPGGRYSLFDLRDGLGDRGGFAAVDDDFRAHVRQPGDGGEPDAAGRAGDQRALSGEVDVHSIIPFGRSSCRQHGDCGLSIGVLPPAKTLMLGLRPIGQSDPAPAAGMRRGWRRRPNRPGECNCR